MTSPRSEATERHQDLNAGLFAAEACVPNQDVGPYSLHKETGKPFLLTYEQKGAFLLSYVFHRWFLPRNIKSQRI